MALMNTKLSEILCGPCQVFVGLLKHSSWAVFQIILCKVSVDASWFSGHNKVPQSECVYACIDVGKENQNKPCILVCPNACIEKHSLLAWSLEEITLKGVIMTHWHLMTFHKCKADSNVHWQCVYSSGIQQCVASHLFHSVGLCGQLHPNHKEIPTW